MFLFLVRGHRFGTSYQMYLFGTISRTSIPKLIPIDEMCIEERPIHTGKLCFLADCYATGPAHTGSI